MRSLAMIGISVLAGLVGSGFVWLTWSLIGNLAARRKAKTKPAEGDKKEEQPADTTKPVEKKK